MSDETKITETEITEETKAAETESTEETAEKKPKKKKGLSPEKIEIVVAVFLGITALLTAWATWIGSLHGGNQSTNYTKSNNLAAEGNSEYNAGMQRYLSDLMAWNTVMDYTFQEEIARTNGNEVEAQLIEAKIDTYLNSNCSEILIHAANEMNSYNAGVTDQSQKINSPFDVKGVKDKYFERANELLSESEEILKEGQQDNAKGDAYNLVNVIYSVVLFLLGIVGIFKSLPNRTVVLVIAVIGLVLATIYMFTIPMPTGFDITSFFSR